MNLFETLKQMKQLVPDEQYVAKSKRAILATAQAPQKNRFVLWRVLETGAAVVLGGFFIMLITGGFSGSSPVQYSVIDTQGLNAEAQAIDIQIQLANFAYPQSTSTAANVKPSRTGNAAAVRPMAVSGTALPATNTASGTPSSTLSIDDALQALSE